MSVLPTLIQHSNYCIINQLVLHNSSTLRIPNTYINVLLPYQISGHIDNTLGRCQNIDVTRLSGRQGVSMGVTFYP